jgi:hypothetical protein
MTVSSASTSLEVSQESAEFHVQTRDPAFANVLPTMGFHPSGPARFTRMLPHTAGIRLIHESFASHLEEILQQCSAAARALGGWSTRVHPADRVHDTRLVARGERGPSRSCGGRGSEGCGPCGQRRSRRG